MLRKLQVPLAALCFLIGSTVYADEGDEELAAMRKRVAALEQQVKDLKSQIAESNAALEEERAKNATSESKAFGSAVDILKALPDDLQPKAPDGWDKFTVTKVVEWMQKNPIGEPFEAKVKVQNVDVRQNPAARVNKSQPEWIATFMLKERDYKYRGVAFTQTISHYGTQPIPVYGNEQFARSAEKIKAGHSVRITGTIRKVVIGAETSGRRKIQVWLNDYAIESPKLDQK